MKYSRVMLVILDGWGINPRKEGNAVKLANTPNINHFLNTYPSTVLDTSGNSVGLPDGLMGNSEVGHMTLGSGRVIWQDIARIDNAIKTGEFFKNREFLSMIEVVKRNKSKLHLIGLVSDGGVHSMDRHYFALLELCKKEGLEKEQVAFHAITDGRDTPPTSGINYIRRLIQKMEELRIGKIATISGRYYGMDRDKRWDRTKLYYEAITEGKGARFSSSIEAVETSYKNGQTDEFIKPIVLIDEVGKPVAVIGDGDGVIFFNFRADRARQITRALTENDFNEFERRTFPKIHYLCMTEYDKTFNLPVAFPPQVVTNTLGEILSKHNLKQLRIAETEKYAHVTYFFNCGVETPYPGEDRVLVHSPKVPTYDLKPEMSSYEVTERVLSAITSQKYNVIILNYANLDMVGHTGNLEAAIKAAEAVDFNLGKVVNTFLSSNKEGVIIICSDHGNAEMMIDYETGQPHTAHTTNPVPCIIIKSNKFDTQWQLREKGGLIDIAPTMLALLGIPQPREMEGKNLILNM